MSTATGTRTSSPSKIPSSASTATPAFQHLVEDIELDDGLDDHELSDSEQLTKNMGGYRNDDSSSTAGTSGVKKMGEVANAISSCTALSFFSISMILANKVRVRWFGWYVSAEKEGESGCRYAERKRGRHRGYNFSNNPLSLLPTAADTGSLLLRGLAAARMR